MARKPKSRRGGFLGSLINQAAVPFTLVAAQNMYTPKKKQGGRRTRRRKSVRRSRRHR
jgi:hypothetical protein